ncbi:MAG TPA: ABC transporter substrate-binding protein, partial [Verrucomicrobiae bacterium]|nr:ABC transporter substrate-binding protein [Verrucomicrobiae bacterium]
MKKPGGCLTLALFVVTVYAGGAPAQEKIRIGLSSVSALHSALWVAEQRGFFRRQGLETEIIVTGQGATAGIGALLANDIQFVSSAGDSLVNAALRGGETVMIAA